MIALSHGIQGISICKYRLFRAASEAPWWLGGGLYLYLQKLEVIERAGGRLDIDDTIYHNFDFFSDVFGLLFRYHGCLLRLLLLHMAGALFLLCLNRINLLILLYFISISQSRLHTQLNRVSIVFQSKTVRQLLLKQSDFPDMHY